ncbi:MAG: UDP-N-acetylmuramate--L-alanine ligase [Chitinivibrionales bacterium]|nr:UDP-N-acetylmuramate--L-alanine ligase [Chitinivibrionales bacterium]MBD3394253.1 UDP-N-acetylmuramate--L-alanine ligase [Chitinivibrionales bacterium]
MLGVYPERVHFVGIGGAGMSALAEILHGHGHAVTGSDLRRTALTERLESLGIGVQYGHEPALVTDAALVVYSSAVRHGNPERRYAERHDIAVTRRAEMLGELMRMHTSIGVAGTHGKTTTTSLIGHVLAHAGLDPTIVVGGTLRARESNAVIGRGGLLVAEADEYDRSFLSMHPLTAVITNIEADHLDCYRDIDDIKSAFLKYARGVPAGGRIVACGDDRHARDVVSRIDKTVITYGTENDADYIARDLRVAQGRTLFTVARRGAILGQASIPLAGVHNVRNSLATVSVCCEMGISFDVVCGGLAGFAGIRRRFEPVGVCRGMTVIDDYAHHPTEIAATLAAARGLGFARIIAVFQPHLYTRTRDFMDAFAQSLSAADVAVVTEIYKAREEGIAGVSGRGIVERMRAGRAPGAVFVETKEQAVDAVTATARAGDGIVLMGAGDICDIGPKLLERFSHE